MKQFPRLLVLVLSAALQTSFSLQPVCDPNCNPDPGSSTYSSVILIRPLLVHARGFGGLAPRYDVAGSLQLFGSQSYSFAMPVLSLPGRNGLDVNLTLYYNSQVWTVNGTAVTFNADRDFPSYGFRLDYGYLEKDATNNAYVLTEADGTKHRLNNTATNSYDSTDTTYIHLDTTTSTAPLIYYKNGRRVKYEPFAGTSTTLFRPIELADSNGNYISIAYVAGTNQRISTITDTLGRVITFGYNANNRLSSVSHDGRTWTFEWNDNYVLTYNFSLTVNDSPASNSTLPVLTKIGYPNGTAYSFAYGAWGMVNSISRFAGSNTLSTTSYNYPDTTAALSDAPTYTTQTVTHDGTSDQWSYAITKSGGLVSSTIITNPFGNKTVTNLSTSGSSSGLVSNIHLQNASSQDLRVMTYTWAFDTSGANARVDNIVTTLSDSGQQSKVAFAYDSYGNVTSLKEYDYGLVFMRETVTTYLLNTTNYPHIFDRPSQVLIKDGSGAIFAHTDFAYDESSFSSQPTGVTNHFDTWTTYRGNLTTITRYKSASAGTGAIGRILIYDWFGNVTSAQLDCCNQKTWIYSSVTAYAYPDSVTSGRSGGTQLTTSATYNFQRGTVATATDPNGKTTSYLYDSSDRVTTVTLPNLVPVITAYDDTSATPSITRSNSFNSAIGKASFDGLGRLKKNETFNSTTLISTIQRTFDAAGRVLTVTNPYGPTETSVATTTAYDSLGRVSTVTPPSGGYAQYSYYGNQALITDPAGKQRRNYVDALNRLVRVDEPGWHDGTRATGSLTVGGTTDRKTKLFDGSVWYWEYDWGQIDVTVGSYTASVGYTGTSTPSGLAASIASALNGTGSPVSAVASGNVVSITSNSASSSGNMTLSASSYTQDNPPFPAGTTSFPVSASGSTLTGGVDPTTPSGPSINTPLVSTYTYDPLDDLTQTSEGYVALYNGTSQAGQVRSYIYDSLGRATQATTPESGTVTYTYFDHGGAQTRTDARGVVTTYSYDSLNRMNGITYSDSTPSVTLAYDVGGAAANALGRLTSMTDGSGSETYVYNAMGALASRSKSVTGDANAYVTSYGYDNLGGLTSITYPSGRVVSQTYDAIGRLSQISSSGTNYLSGMSYNAAGQTLGFNYGNGVSAQFAYNDHLQISTLRYYSGTTDLFKLTYGYGTGNNGQMQSITDTVNGSSKSQAFTYDAWSRLRIAQTSDLTSANTWKLEWTYDRIGNRLTQTQTGGTATNIIQPQLTVSDTTNRITTSGYTYDAAGNMTNDSIHTYTYDGENRIKTLDGGGTYVYDGTGLRVKKGTTTYVWSGTEVIAEYSGGSLQKEYVYAGSRLLATLSASGAPTYSHPDHLSTRLETDSTGTVTRTFGHLPFGDSWYETGTSGKLLFTGYERDNAVGDSQLDYAVMRYHSPRLGRLVTPDPLGGNLLNPQTFNRYSYVGNDPVNRVDHLGLEWACVDTGTGEPDCSWYEPLSNVNAGDICPASGCELSGGMGGQHGGGGGGAGGIKVGNPTGAGKQVTSAFQALLKALQADPDCLKYLNANGIDALLVGQAILDAGTLGQGDITENGDKYSTDAISPGGKIGTPEGNFAIIVNSTGSFFSDTSTSGVGPNQRRTLNPGMKRELTGGTQQAQTFILLHELSHVTMAARKDAGNIEAGKANNRDLEKNCGKTLGLKK